VSRYRFTHAERATYPVAVLCRVLRVSRAGYYAWAGRGASARAQADADLAAQIAAAHARSRATYGAPRIHAALRAARLMRAAGLAGFCRRRRVRTTIADPAQAPAPNLVARDFTATAIDRLWLGDITYVPTQEG
jgi:putative transposase